MDPDDLLELLDLGAAPAHPAGESVVSPTGPAPPPGPTALVLDEWGLRRGRELVAESDRLRAAGTTEFAAADFFAAAFDPDPVLAGACADARRHAFVRELLGTPEYRALHAATRLDDTAAGIAAAHFAEQFAALPEPPSGGAAAGGAGEEIDVMRAVGRAVVAAAGEVGEMREAAAGLGMGPGLPGSNDPAAVAALFKRVRSDPVLRRVCELAGKFRRVARSRQRLKTTHGLDDVVGVEPGGDVARLLPSELVRLAAPEFEPDALRRLAEREALCREHHATEPVGRGPVVVCVDESGSMAGAKVHAAKALALALAWVARHQRRWCALVAYSGDTGERLLPLPPGRWDENAVADWVRAFLGGGSNVDVPVRELPRMYRDLGAPPGVTDVVFVTDAVCRLPPDVKNRFLDWKAAARARLVTLVVGGAGPGDLAGVSDEVHAVAALTPDSDAAARVLSL